MSKRHDKVQPDEAQKELTRKEQLLRHRDRERHKKLYTFVGIALGLALLLVLVGVVYQFLIFPNQTAARVGDVSISAAAFQKRAQFEKASLQGQLQQMQQLEQQFGGQGFFQTQIAQIQATLASPFSLGSQALDGMIEDILIAQEAAARGITVSDEEVEQALREEVANSQGLVTESQATATATAGAAATATAAQWTPTPTATVDPNAAITATAAVTPTVAPQPAAVITETAYTEGLAAFERNLAATAGFTLAEYRDLIRGRLLRDKLSEVIGEEQVAATEEQVRARHILLAVAEPTPTPSAPITGADTLTGEVDSGVSITATEEMTAPVSEPMTDTGAVTETGAVTDTLAGTNAEPAANVVTDTATVTGTAAETAPITATAAAASTAAATATAEITAAEITTAEAASVITSAVTTAITSTEAATGPVTATGELTATPAVAAADVVSPAAAVTTTTAVTATGALPATGALTATETLTGTHGPYSDVEALALADELRARILAGEDFAALARAYSDDTGSAVEGGDLGWFGRGRMVAPFEEAAFSLPIGEVSEPIKTDFGYHLIEVLERDPARAKDEAQLQQERAEAFQTWLNEQLAGDQVQRPGDLSSLLPPGL